jgi:SAM-dependent methyltransferase
MSINHLQSYNREIREWLLKVFEKASRFSPEQMSTRPCPVCGSKNFTPFVNNDYLDYVRCAACDLVFQNPTVQPKIVNDGFEGGDPLLAEYFNIAARYKTEIPGKPDPQTHGKLKDIFALRKNGHLLDVGCSVGDFLHLAKHFYEVEGVEINPRTAAIAKPHFTVHTDYLAALDLPPEYDIVTLHQILYGVPDPVGLLRSIHAVLKPDGLLYINTPNASSYATRVFGGKCCHFYGYTSLNIFDPGSLAELARRTGFRVAQLRTEWFDVYSMDIQEFFDHPDQFIHKRNCHLEGYEEAIAAEDELQRRLGRDLGHHGNYMIAILTKA